MCCGGKCLFFIPIKTGSLIFGYIIAVISALGTIACTGVDMFFIIRLMFKDYNYSYNSYNNSIDWQTRDMAETIRTIIIVTGFLMEFLSSFICSVFMLVGLTQNKPALVKTFLIYGMVQVVLLLVFFIMLHCATSFFYAGFLFLALAIVGIYVMCLYMVFKVYQSMTEGHVFVNPPVNPVLQLLTSRLRREQHGEVISSSGI